MLSGFIGTAVFSLREVQQFALEQLAAQGRDAAPKAAPENFDQFITGRNVVKNKAVVDLASCYYWDGNN